MILLLRVLARGTSTFSQAPIRSIIVHIHIIFARSLSRPRDNKWKSQGKNLSISGTSMDKGTVRRCTCNRFLGREKIDERPTEMRITICPVATKDAVSTPSFPLPNTACIQRVKMKYGCAIFFYLLRQATRVLLTTLPFLLQLQEIFASAPNLRVVFLFICLVLGRECDHPKRGGSSSGQRRTNFFQKGRDQSQIDKR